MLVLVILMVTCAEISITLVYFQLTNEALQWDRIFLALAFLYFFLEGRGLGAWGGGGLGQDHIDSWSFLAAFPERGFRGGIPAEPDVWILTGSDAWYFGLYVDCGATKTIVTIVTSRARTSTQAGFEPAKTYIKFISHSQQ